MFNKGVVLLVAVILLSLSAQGTGKDYYVDSSRDPHTQICEGTAENPWATITQALKELISIENDPAVINIAPGFYNGDSGEVFPLQLSNNTHLKGDNRETTIIDASGSEESSVILLMEVENIIIENLTLRGGTGTRCQSG